MLIVQNYGVRCVADAAGIRATAAAIAAAVRGGDRLIVTVSATDRERKAATLLSAALHDLGIPAESFTGARAGIVTDSERTGARITAVRTARLRSALEAGHVPVVDGAEGIGPRGRTASLGQGGSDTTAVALGAALGASVCEILTGAPGVLSADPRIVPAAHVLPRVSFEMLYEMCLAGCKNPAARAVELARDRLVPLRVRSPFGPRPGTWVDHDGEDAVAVVSDRARRAARVSVVGCARAGSTLLDVLSGAGITAKLCGRSPVRLTCAVPAAAASRAVAALHEAFAGEARGGPAAAPASA